MSRKGEIYRTARETARELRNNPTKAEKRVWEILKNRQIENCKFLRQHPLFFNNNQKLSFYIPDFYCHELKLAIEIDGKIHSKQQNYDTERDLLFQDHQINVLRISNEETRNSDDLINKITNCIRVITSSPSLN